jgi:aldose 1-epimerase
MPAGIAHPLSPSGAQYEIRYGDQRAVITEVGGGIRRFTTGGRAVLYGYARDEHCPFYAGKPLVPWPNRIADGRYVFGGVEHQLAINEPERRNAIHGLLQWRPWKRLAHGLSHVVLAARLHPMQGYPFDLDVRITYRLSSDGLHVVTRARNVGGAPCPCAVGQHPLFSTNGAALGEWLLQVDADAYVILDDERRLPAATVHAAAIGPDFRRPNPIGERQTPPPLHRRTTVTRGPAAMRHLFSALTNSLD